jgi:hypothetical protein
MYGPARCVARDFDELAVSGLASMYPASSWSSVLRAIMGISVDAIFLARILPLLTLDVPRARARGQGPSQ